MRNAFQGCAAAWVVRTVLFAAVLYGPSLALAGPILGSAQSFAVLGASTVTNTGSSTIKGDLGLYAGTSITGYELITHTGTLHQTDGAAQFAQIDVTTAYNSLAALPFTTNLSGLDLGSRTLGPGVYFFSSTAQLTGALILDASSNPNALFVFQIGSALTTASGSSVELTNGGANNGVFWQVGSSATLGFSTSFAGNILALESITMDSTAKILCGRALARTGAVTLITNTISNDCGNGGDFGTGREDFGSAGFSAGGGLVAVPEPGSVTLFSIGFLGLLLFGWRSLKRTA
jgi:type VI secretion system secreted protein VgrG